MRKDEVSKWRADHISELDKTLQVLISIRDNEDSTDKSRIDAGVAIAKLLGGVAPDKGERKEDGFPALKGSHEAGLEELLLGLQ